MKARRPIEAARRPLKKKTVHPQPVIPRDVASRLVRQRGAELDAFLADPHASTRDLVATSTALAGATRALVRIDAGGAITPRKILSSEPWRELRQTLVDALRPLPGGVAALEAALAKLEREAAS